MNKAQEIFSIAENLKGKVPNIRDLADQAIRSDWTVEYFREEAMSRLPNIKPIQSVPLSDLGASARDWSRYSLRNVILSQLPGGTPPDIGLEREFSQQIARESKRSAEGMFVPNAILDGSYQRNFVSGVSSLGGALVSFPTDGSQFADMFRNRAQVIALGARVLQLNTPVSIPRQVAAGATAWVTETQAASLATGSFGSFSLTPKVCSAFQQFSRQLLFSSDPSIDMLVRDDINQQIALALDLGALHGGGGSEPTGIANTTGINTVALNANGQVLGPNTSAYPFLVSLQTECANDNADVANMAYLCRSSHKSQLLVSQRFSSTDSPVWETRLVNGMPEGVIAGYKAAVSNQIATNLTTGSATTICSAIFFGNWNDLIIARFGPGTDVVVDPYVLAVNGVTRVIARAYADVGVRRPQSFCVGGGLL